MNSAILDLENAAGTSLIQREPYPVIAPNRWELIAEIIRIALSRQQKVLVFGSGSSFDTQFALLRDNVIAITTSKLAGVTAQGNSSFAAGPGTLLPEIISNGDFYAGRTLGGFLASNLAGCERELRRILRQHLSAIEIIDGSGGMRRLPAPSQSTTAYSSGAEQIIGSNGRSGIITRIEFSLKPPIRIELDRKSVV